MKHFRFLNIKHLLLLFGPLFGLIQAPIVRQLALSLFQLYQ